MSDQPEKSKPAPRKGGQLRNLEPVSDMLFGPLPEAELWWWEIGDEPDPCGPPE